MSDTDKVQRSLSIQAVQRMPYYLEFLKERRRAGATMIPASTLAERFNLSEIQARKDLAAVCRTSGKPRAGFVIDDLILDIETLLGFNDVSDAVLVGAGHLGQALMNYSGFASYGLNIVAAFDCDTAKVGTTVNGKPILPISEIPNLCQRMNIHIGIIAVPAASAQEVCDGLVAGGVIGIWNFAQTQLIVDEGIMVQNENMAAPLAMLSQHVRQRLLEGWHE